MSKKIENESGGKFKSLTVNQDTYEEMETLRRREQEELGLPELSWNNFFARLVKKLKDQEKAR